MFQVHINENYIKELLQEAINAKLDSVSQELVFWDMKELQRRTRMSVNTMKEHFFYDEDFPKAKVGNKCIFQRQKLKIFYLNG